MKIFIAKTFVVTLAVIAVGFLLGAKSSQEVKEYDYVSIVEQGTAHSLWISTNHDEYEFISNKGKGLDYSLMLKKINEFESKGYEVFENTFTDACCFTLMRKPK